jgi:hypothetical protein
MAHTREPGPGHHLLMADLHGVLDKYEQTGIPAVEQIALLGQIIGQKCAELDPKAYDTPELLRTVALNITAGNRNRVRALGPTLNGEVLGHG